MLGIENHQDFSSAELVAFCELAGRASASPSTPATPFRSPRRRSTSRGAIAPHVRHVHLKDYRVQFTDEGFRLVRCAIGDGAVPFARAGAILAEHHDTLTAVLEPGALEARHVRFSPTTGGTAIRRRPRASSPPA